MIITKRTYKDLDLNFTAHPVTGDVTKNKDINAIIGSVRNLLYTNFYERPFQPQIGSNLRRLLFEPIDAFTTNAIADDIRNTIKNYEPRVSIEAIEVEPDYDRNSYLVSLTFFIQNDPEPINVSFYLQRVR
jgi:hypothetical protein